MKKPISIQEYDYALPDDRIAKYPLKERDSAKLLTFSGERIDCYSFLDVPTLISPESLLIFNESRVVRARLRFRKTTGSFIELFVLEPYGMDIPTAYGQTGAGEWICLVGNARRWKTNILRLSIGDNEWIEAEKIKRIDEAYLISFRWTANMTFSDILERIGDVPLPPYIKRNAEPEDVNRYQTVFAKVQGSVAAPTAGLHFTENLLETLYSQGIDMKRIILHVGAGTFKPVAADDVAEHVMHVEQIYFDLHTLKFFRDNSLKCFTPVGTTSVRSMESLYWFAVKIMEEGESAEFNVCQWFPYAEHKVLPSRNQAFDVIISWMESKNISFLSGKTSLLIVPGYQFMMTDAMFTNFHQPKSTLLLLVSAFIGEQWKEVYDYALCHDFRFLSYGDSCFFQRKQ